MTKTTAKVICASALVLAIASVGRGAGTTGFLHEGSAVVWGYDYAGAVSAKPTDTTFTHISAGWYHCVALRSDGTLAAWGSTMPEMTTVPTGGGFVQISGGVWSSLALKADGSIVGWGQNSRGEINVPAGTGYKQVAAAGPCAVAIRANDSIVAWGGFLASQVSGTGYRQVSSGNGSVLGLKNDGSITQWGSLEVPPPAGTDFTAVSFQTFHGLALKTDGSVAGWGSNGKGQINVPAGNDFVKISAGGYSSLALRSNGTLAAWGNINTAPADGTYLEISATILYDMALKARMNYQDLLIKNVDNFSSNDTLLQRQVGVSGNVKIDGKLDWEAAKGHMAVGGQLTILGGSELNVVLDSAQLHRGDRFDLFDTGQSVVGQFTQVNLPTLDSGMIWDTSSLYSTGEVVVAPEPASLGILGLGIAGLLAGRRR